MLPKISVITPCYNMVKYIETTILSVISQKYENLEYIIIDGGSTDGTLEIINKYRSKISVVVSEEDEGQYDAINKGFSLATGDIIAWLNADDQYYPWTLSGVGKVFSKFQNVDWIIGKSSFLDSDGYLTHVYSLSGSKPRQYIAKGYFRDNLYGFLQQESMFWRRSLLDKAGKLNTSYRLAADFELWTRFAKHVELVSFDIPLAAFRQSAGSRSNRFKDIYQEEKKQVADRLAKCNPLRTWFGNNSVITNQLQRVFTVKKTPIIYYNIRMKEFVFRRICRSISNQCLSDYVKQVY